MSMLLVLSVMRWTTAVSFELAPIAWEVAPEVRAATKDSDPYVIIKSLRLLPRVYIASQPILIEANDSVIAGSPSTLRASESFDANCDKLKIIDVAKNMMSAPGAFHNLTISDLEIDGYRNPEGKLIGPSALRQSAVGLSISSIGGSAGAVSSGLVLERLYIHDHNFACLMVDDWSDVILRNITLAHVANGEYTGYAGQSLKHHELSCGGERYAWYCNFAHTLYFTRTNRLLIENSNFTDAMFGTALTFTGCYNTVVRGCYFANIRQSAVYHANGGYTRDGDNMTLIGNRAENVSSIATVGSPNFDMTDFHGTGFLFGIFLHGASHVSARNINLQLGGATPSAADTDMGPSIVLADAGSSCSLSDCNITFASDVRPSSLLALDGKHVGVNDNAITGITVGQTTIYGPVLDFLLDYVGNQSQSCQTVKQVLLANSTLSGHPHNMSSWAGASKCPLPIQLDNVQYGSMDSKWVYV